MRKKKGRSCLPSPEFSHHPLAARRFLCSQLAPGQPFGEDLTPKVSMKFCIWPAGQEHNEPPRGLSGLWERQGPANPPQDPLRMELPWLQWNVPSFQSPRGFS